MSGAIDLHNAVSGHLVLIEMTGGQSLHDIPIGGAVLPL